MATLLKHTMLIRSNVNANNNKFWEAKVYDDGTFHVRNGRVGGDGQIQPVKNLGVDAAIAKFEAKKKEKLNPKKRGGPYVESKVLLSESGKVNVTAPKIGGSLADIAVKQIDSSSSETAKLIRYLSKKNIHNITTHSTIEYDANDDVLKTPLGIVTQEGIDEARVLLDELVPFVKRNDYGNHRFIEKLQDYIQIIPRKVGRKLIAEDVFPNMDAFKKEGQLLDALDASLQQVLSSTGDEDKADKKVKKDAPKIFNVEINKLDNRKEVKRIEDYYNRTKNRMHSSHNLKVKKIYVVKIKHMEETFRKKGKSIGNIMELFHGSRVENILSILKGGLIIPPSSSSHVTGRMFGSGVYASNQSSKASNYSLGYWGHGSYDTNCFLFVVDFAMGKYYVPSGPSGHLPSGYNSIFAKANRSGVMNNEMIVPKIFQCNIKYLLELTS